MEIVDPSDLDKHHHAWLEWLGLEEPPAEAGSWVPVVRGLEIDDPKQSSTVGTRLVAALADAGIEAHQRLHEYYDIVNGGYVPQTRMDACIGVVVHQRDIMAAVEIATAMKTELETESPGPDGSTGLTDEELTRMALDAGPPPPE